MNPNQGREAAYVTSRVKDLSLITNTPDYVGLFACITPKAHSSLEESENKIDIDGDKVYAPQLVRDVDTLDQLFGDPRVDPKTYRDLYLVRNIVQNGFACYIAKVKSGEPFSATVGASGLFDNTVSVGCPVNTQLDDPSLAQLRSKLENLTLFTVQSSYVGTSTLEMKLVPYKPYSINQVVLSVVFKSRAVDTVESDIIVECRANLAPDTKNADLLQTLNAYLGGEISLSLPDNLKDSLYASVEEAGRGIGDDYVCIANALLYICGLYNLKDISQSNPDLYLENMELVGLSSLTGWTDSYKDGNTFTCSTEYASDGISSHLNVGQANYISSLKTYNDPKYAGCFISELSAIVTKEVNKDFYLPFSYVKLSGDLNPNVYQYVNLNEFISDTDNYVIESSSNNTFVPRKIFTKTVNDSEVEYTAVLDWDKTEDQTYYVPKAGVTDPTQDSDFDSIKESDVTNEIKEVYEKISANSYTKILDFNNTENHYYIQQKSSYDISVNNELKIPSPSVQGTLVLSLTVYEPSSYKKDLNPSNPYQMDYIINSDGKYVKATEENSKKTDIVEMSSDNRRGLHYIIKQIASLRKDLTCVFTTPYHPNEEEDEGIFDLNKACNWVAARGEYSDLFEYGNSQAIDYSDQSFYCEMYWSWLKWRVAKLVNGLATGSSVVEVPATGFVILNSLASYRAKGAYYPVAGDQGGVLPDTCTILQNPSTKSQRDKLISYRINPIFDTGLRGIQIYGNDTLNPQYTDLSASHIARTLVQIRSSVDRYTETIKFKLNDQFTWGGWINYVSTRILEPIKAGGGLTWYSVNMGLDTTTRTEISQRKIRGMVSLQFVQALEIIDLEFTVYSSALEMQ